MVHTKKEMQEELLLLARNEALQAERATTIWKKILQPMALLN